MSENTRGLKCIQCNLNFANEKALQKHQNDKHSQTVTKCIKCNLRFTTLDSFRVHWNKRHVVTSKIESAPSTVSFEEIFFFNFNFFLHFTASIV